MSKLEIAEEAAKLAVTALEHTPARAAVEAGERLAGNALKLLEESSVGKKIDSGLHELHISDIEALKKIVVGEPGSGLTDGWFGDPLRKSSEVSLLMKHGAVDFMPGSAFYPEKIHDLLRPDELPLLKPEHARAIHFTTPDSAKYVAENGLNYTKYGDASFMARGFGDPETTHYLAPGKYKGAVAVVMDVPYSEWKSHLRSFFGSSGVIPPQRIVGVVGMPRMEQPLINDAFVEPEIRSFGGSSKRPGGFKRPTVEVKVPASSPEKPLYDDDVNVW